MMRAVVPLGKLAQMQVLLEDCTLLSVAPPAGSAATQLRTITLEMQLHWQPQQNAISSPVASNAPCVAHTTARNATGSGDLACNAATSVEVMVTAHEALCEVLVRAGRLRASMVAAMQPMPQSHAHLRGLQAPQALNNSLSSGAVTCKASIPVLPEQSRPSSLGCIEPAPPELPPSATPISPACHTQHAPEYQEERAQSQVNKQHRGPNPEAHHRNCRPASSKRPFKSPDSAALVTDISRGSFKGHKPQRQSSRHGGLARERRGMVNKALSRQAPSGSQQPTSSSAKEDRCETDAGSPRRQAKPNVRPHGSKPGHHVLASTESGQGMPRCLPLMRPAIPAAMGCSLPGSPSKEVGSSDKPPPYSNELVLHTFEVTVVSMWGLPCSGGKARQLKARYLKYFFPGKGIQSLAVKHSHSSVVQLYKSPHPIRS